jgi:hypothetical protein
LLISPFNRYAEYLFGLLGCGHPEDLICVKLISAAMNYFNKNSLKNILCIDKGDFNLKKGRSVRRRPINFDALGSERLH